MRDIGDGGHCGQHKFQWDSFHGEEKFATPLMAVATRKVSQKMAKFIYSSNTVGVPATVSTDIERRVKS